MAKIKLGLVTAWGECGMGYLAKNWVHTFNKYPNNIDYQIYFNHEYFIIGADQNGPDQIENSDHNKKIVLVLGSESRGIDTSIKNKMNKVISIEKLGYGESLNLAIAGSILMKNIAIK